MFLFSSRRLSAAGILFLCTIGTILSGCGVLPGSLERSDENIHSWNPGAEWTVEVTYWPDRLKDPYAENASRIQERWTYRVLDQPKNQGGYRIRVRQDTTAFLLRFNDGRTLLSVDRILERRRNHVKIERVHSSPTENRVFLVPGWNPDRAVFWAHPYPTFTEATREYNYVRGGRSVQKRLTQRVRQENDSYRYDVRSPSEHQRATFVWNAGSSWWSEARFFVRGRLVLRAVRTDK